MSGFKPIRHRHDDALSRTSWQDFERLVAHHFRQAGYRVEHRGTGEGARRTDGGIDLLLHREQEVILVQCKHWTAFQVPHNAVHELIGVMHTAYATGAIVITSGEFTKAAIDAAAKFRHVRLIDGRAIRAMLGPIPEPAPLEMPSWVNRSRVPAPARARRPFMAAAAAVLVMAAALTTLYDVYIQQIRDAQAVALRTARQATGHTAAAPRAVVPALSSAPSHASVINTVNGHPAVVHDAPMSKRDLAEWAKQNAEAMRILEATTPEVP